MADLTRLKGDLSLMNTELGGELDSLEEKGVTWNNVDEVCKGLLKRQKALSEALYEVVSYLRFKEDQGKI